MFAKSQETLMANKKPSPKRKPLKQTTKRRTPALKAPPPPKISVTRNSAPPRPSTPAAAPARSTAGRVVTAEQIARRAYEIWQRQGGSEVENWLRAECELRGT